MNISKCIHVIPEAHTRSMHAIAINKVGDRIILERSNVRIVLAYVRTRGNINYLKFL